MFLKINLINIKIIVIKIEDLIEFLNEIFDPYKIEHFYHEYLYLCPFLIFLI